jgi:hypothetical protein
MKIGNRTVILQQTLLVPDRLEASFASSINGIDYTFVLQFTPEMAKPDDKPTVKWVGVGNVVRIEFVGWVNPLGTTFGEPQKLGSIAGFGDLFCNVFHQHVGTLNRIDFQVLK